MVGVMAKSMSSSWRAATPPRRSKHFLDTPRPRRRRAHRSSGVESYIVQEDRVGSKRISPAASLQHEIPLQDCLGPVEEPEEPFEIDQPIQCPASEPSIMEDGILWRARILASLRRRNDIIRKEREPVMRGGSFPTRRREQSRSMESNTFLYVAHSAPENQVRSSLLPE